MGIFWRNWVTRYYRPRGGVAEEMAACGGAGRRTGGVTRSDQAEIIAKWTNISYTGGNKAFFNCLYLSAAWSIKLPLRGICWIPVSAALRLQEALNPIIQIFPTTKINDLQRQKIGTIVFSATSWKMY